VKSERERGQEEERRKKKEKDIEKERKIERERESREQERQRERYKEREKRRERERERERERGREREIEREKKSERKKKKKGEHLLLHPTGRPPPPSNLSRQLSGVQFLKDFCNDEHLQSLSTFGVTNYFKETDLSRVKGLTSFRISRDQPF
jgi:hypothetical protein